ncbi:MAG: cadherin-like beta sandwich domain-containing protein [Nitrospirota bacterium]
MRRDVFAVFGLVVIVAGILGGCASDDGPTGDPSLTALAVDLGPFNETFDSSVTAYTVSTVFLTTQTTVTATATEADATITVNGGTLTDPVSLVEGRNVLSVRVVTTGGAARVYTIEVTRGTEVNFAQQAYAKASNTGADDHFGYSVALNGDTMVVGAPSEDSAATGVDGDGTSNNAANSGAVYVFVRSGTTWSQQAYLKASNTGAGDQFGWSVSLEGETLVVGAPSEDSTAVGIDGDQADDSASNAGAVYVFVRSGTTWTQQAYLKASNTGAGDRFGWRVALSGETVTVGALGEDSVATGIDGDQADDSASNAGAVYVFTRSGTIWSQEAYVKASNTDAGDVFGVSVALSGDTLAAGAAGESSIATGIDGTPQTSNGATSSGAVYVFTRAGTAWAQQAYLKASNTGAADAFGTSLALEGDTLAVGAPLEDSATTGIDSVGNNSAIDTGAVYVFFRSGGITGTWAQQAYVKASNTNAGDLFGWRVALSGDTLAIGAPSEDSAATGVDATGVGQPDNSAATAGAVYVFSRSGTTWSQLDYVKASNTAGLDGFGGSVAVSIDTVAVGAIGEDSNAMGIDGDQANNIATTAGAVYVLQ